MPFLLIGEVMKSKNYKEKYSKKYAAMLEGARRVGKSTIAEEFARTNFKTYIKIDFANIDKELLEVFDVITNLDLFFLRLQTVTGVTLYENESVIIFDEIQRQPYVRQAIKYLVADGRYCYIETGSFISIKQNVKNIVIPSEEHFIQIYPMDYEEFLLATGNTTYNLLMARVKATYNTLCSSSIFDFVWLSFIASFAIVFSF